MVNLLWVPNSYSYLFNSKKYMLNAIAESVAQGIIWLIWTFRYKVFKSLSIAEIIFFADQFKIDLLQSLCLFNSTDSSIYWSFSYKRPCLFCLAFFNVKFFIL